jgi:hypothetical protein
VEQLQGQTAQPEALTIDTEQDTIIINRSGRSTYPEEKSVQTSGATPVRRLRLRTTCPPAKVIVLSGSGVLGHLVELTADLGKHRSAELVDGQIVLEHLPMEDGDRRFLTSRVSHPWPIEP